MNEKLLLRCKPSSILCTSIKKIDVGLHGPDRSSSRSFFTLEHIMKLQSFFDALQELLKLFNKYFYSAMEIVGVLYNTPSYADKSSTFSLYFFLSFFIYFLHIHWGRAFVWAFISFFGSPQWYFRNEITLFWKRVKTLFINQISHKAFMVDGCMYDLWLQ